MITCNDPGSLVLYWIYPQALSAHCDWALQASTQAVSSSFVTYLKTFLITNILELPFYFFVLRGRSIKSKFIGLLAGNLLTHPLVYFVFPLIFAKLNASYASYITTGEVFAFTAEIIFILIAFRTPKLLTMVTLFLANIFSWWVGGMFVI